MDPVSSGLVSTLGQVEAHYLPNTQGGTGCTFNAEEEMLPKSSPQGNNYKPHGWKRIVTEWPHDEVQLLPMQRKCSARDEVNEIEVGVLVKKHCVIDTTQKQTAKATGQPHREQ